MGTPSYTMATTAPQYAVQAAVIEQLRKHGWALLHMRPHAILVKDYMTAVGVRTASVQFWFGPPHEPGMRASAQYDSEGRNALSTTHLTVAEDAGCAQIAATIAKFASAIDCAVDSTYARGLYLRRPPERAGATVQSCCTSRVPAG